jgi:hypothetical protein
MLHEIPKHIRWPLTMHVFSCSCRLRRNSGSAAKIEHAHMPINIGRKGGRTGKSLCIKEK